MPDTDEQVKQDEKAADAPAERTAVEERAEAPVLPPVERAPEPPEARVEARSETAAETRPEDLDSKRRGR